MYIYICFLDEMVLPTYVECNIKTVHFFFFFSFRPRKDRGLKKEEKLIMEWIPFSFHAWSKKTYKERERGILKMFT